MQRSVPTLPPTMPTFDDPTELDALALSRAIHTRAGVVPRADAGLPGPHPPHEPAASTPSSTWRPTTTCCAQADTCDAELARGRSRGWMHGLPQAIKDTGDALASPPPSAAPLLKDARPAATASSSRA
jgi:amidase